MKLFQKAQMESFISLIILISALVFFVLYTRQEEIQLAGTRTDAILKEKTRDYMAVNSITQSFTTHKGIPFEELLGVYACYGEGYADYGSGIDFDIDSIIRERFDEMYGKNNWAVIFYEQELQSLPPLPFISDSSGSMSDDLEIIRRIRDAISAESDITLLDTFGAYGAPQVTECDLGGIQPDENWAGTAAYLCEHGRPVLEDGAWTFVPWTDDRPKVIFVSSDEASCSGTPCGSPPRDFTEDYVDEAIAKCNEAGVKVYYLMPSTLPDDINCPSIYPLDMQYVDKITSQTGGRIIHLVDSVLAVIEIASDLGLDTYDTFITETSSQGISDQKQIPDDRDIHVFSLIVPCPCSPVNMCKANVLYSPIGGFEDYDWEPYVPQAGGDDDDDDNDDAVDDDDDNDDDYSDDLVDYDWMAANSVSRSGPEAIYDKLESMDPDYDDIIEQTIALYDPQIPKELVYSILRMEGGNPITQGGSYLCNGIDRQCAPCGGDTSCAGDSCGYCGIMQVNKGKCLADANCDWNEFTDGSIKDQIAPGIGFLSSNVAFLESLGMSQDNPSFWFFIGVSYNGGPGTMQCLLNEIKDDKGYASINDVSWSDVMDGWTVSDNYILDAAERCSLSFILNYPDSKPREITAAGNLVGQGMSMFS